MKLESLIEAASAGYPDGLVQQYFEKPEENHGDSLAKFIMTELSETFDEDAGDEDQLLTAIRQLRRARNELETVIAALCEME